MTAYFNNCETAAKKLIDHVGKTIIIGVPLGLGKPVGLLNALYRLASDDDSIQLTIITALTLARPVLRNELEKKFINPILDRMLNDYEEPLYEKARELNQLPNNINVIEFFLTPGKFLHHAYVQQNYISSSYSNVARDVINLSINVLAQQISPSEIHKDLYSLSCNTDLFHEVKEYLTVAERQGSKTAIIAEVNANLPFMYGDVAEVNSSLFTDIIDTKKYSTLFSAPREELTLQDHLIGLYGSCLIKDGGCLQIGIGKLSDALASALVFRHQKNDLYQGLLHRLHVEEKFGEIISKIGSTDVFSEGLYASTEMLSDEYMHLYKEGVLRKKVYDHVGLQKLLNSKQISEAVTPELLDILLENKIIHDMLSPDDVLFLQAFGIFKNDIKFQDNHLILPTGESILADLSISKSKKQIIDHCLGERLKSGKVVHAGFFFGSPDLYAQLHHLSYEESQQIEMVSISRTNTLLWSPELLQLQRKDARFVNSSLMVTLLGEVISDGLKDYQEVSGVGGQYDFVSMANQLKNAHSIINCRSTRETKKGVQSNIVWDYSNSTLARYLRDIVITEYGIADCRSKTDSEVIKAILNVTDSRFQQSLLEKAKKSGKLPRDYEIPALFRNNYPKSIEKMIGDYESGAYFASYPFGSDLTKDEEVLARVLLFLKNCSRLKLFSLMIASFLFFKSDTSIDKYLLRMGLQNPSSVMDYLYKKLLKYLIVTF